MANIPTSPPGLQQSRKSLYKQPNALWSLGAIHISCLNQKKVAFFSKRIIRSLPLNVSVKIIIGISEYLITNSKTSWKKAFMSVTLGILSYSDANRTTVGWLVLTCSDAENCALWVYEGVSFTPANVDGERWTCSDPLSNPGVMGFIYGVVGRTSLHKNSYKKTGLHERWLLWTFSHQFIA